MVIVCAVPGSVTRYVEEPTVKVKTRFCVMAVVCAGTPVAVAVVWAFADDW